MAISVVMPALEMAQETGKLVSWKKKDGEAVKKGELLLEVETDKAVVEIEAAGDGILGGVTAQIGDVVPVGQTIAWLLKPGEAVPAAKAPTQTGRTGAAANPQAAAPAAAVAVPVADAGPVRISPKARRLAKEHGVDVSKITGYWPWRRNRRRGRACGQECRALGRARGARFRDAHAGCGRAVVDSLGLD